MISRRGRDTRWLFALVALFVVAGCRRSCTWRPGGASEKDSQEDAMGETPECREVREKHSSCMSSIFDVKWSCGPDEGECIASARARLRCKLAIPGNYDCRREGSMKSMSPMTPPECRSFAHLCTGKDRETTIIDAGSPGR